MYDDYDERMTRVTILQVSVKTIVGYNFAIAKIAMYPVRNLFYGYIAMDI
jgi:hypothetical protein